MYRTDFWTLWEKARVGCFERTASKHVYYLGWNRSPAQVGCMRQVLGPGALGRPRGIWWRGRWEGGSGWGTHVNPWLIHVSVWQKPLQYCKVISLQLIKINEKQNKTKHISKYLTCSTILKRTLKLFWRTWRWLREKDIKTKQIKNETTVNSREARILVIQERECSRNTLCGLAVKIIILIII